MRLLYIHQYFKTPNEPGGTRSYWIAKKLIDKGNEVTIITSSNKISQNKEIKNIDISEKYLERHAYGMGWPIGIHLGYFYDAFKVTFWINFVHLAQSIKIFYKTKIIYV